MAMQLNGNAVERCKRRRALMSHWAHPRTAKAMGQDVPAVHNTPLYFRLVIRLLRPFPDFDFGFIKSVRALAADLLALHEGDRALDVGCGPGGSLTYLRRAVGDAGEVVGVEISNAVAEQARRRIAHHGWSNVGVEVSPAQTVQLTGVFNGLLMFAAPDVYASPAAWENLRPHLAPNARVVFFGAKTSAPRAGGS